LAPAIKEIPLSFGLPAGFASIPITNGLFNEQDVNYNRRAFRVHRQMLEHPAATRNINDAINAAAVYFAACQHPSIRAVDEEHCKTVGGKYRASKITTAKGWQDIPESIINDRVLEIKTRADIET
jgi:hypothetical protein